ncbi:MAG TPA: spheroidene monooxygenase [Streptosporangiaceae bacterium]|nr:spheroidene monooxygenase [Streptosporangiaceae bacterium]
MIASFHLTRYRPGQAVRAASRMAFDRPVLAGTPGLRFWKLLGTARDGTMSLGADPRRWAMFAVWQDHAALDRFLASSPVPAGWRLAGRETWSVRLRYAGGHGRWAGRDPFSGLAAAVPEPGQPVAVLTRAAIRARRLARFYRSVPAVDGALARADGCLRAVGMGEWPAARQATFSLWRDGAAIRAFAYAAGPHRAVVARTRAEDWFAEECFARFVPGESAGSWDGHDPLRPG